MTEALDVLVKGIVQGVGFRPFVYRSAQMHHISGWVCNALEGVRIHSEGTPDDLDRFVLEVHQNRPAAALIKEIDMDEVAVEGFDSFEIRFSENDEASETTLVSPDLATCDTCVAELFDPENRRYRYPFINCTNCGPRFTIMQGLPYDRAASTMKAFEMCPTCQAEYDDPANRRFHAQPNACFNCGPSLGWIAADEGTDALTVEGIQWAHNREESDALLANAVAYLRAGKIVAVKGLGGYHLVCDATNEEALANLRARKRREGKAFAVMVASVEDAKKVCEVNEWEQHELQAPASPIVLLRKKKEVVLAPGLADALPELGIMLPTTPVQHLLSHDFGGMLVMTSGNLHDEPIVTTEEEALAKLAGIADAFLVNNRAIESRYDDSVVRVIRAGSAGFTTQVIRRARGLAPVPLADQYQADKAVAQAAVDGLEAANQEAVAESVTGGTTAGAGAASGNTSAGNAAVGSLVNNQLVSIFATGPEQKSTFALTRAGETFVSQHIGDMENAETYDAWLATKAHYENLFKITPSVVACDYHPEYLATKWALVQELPVVQVQHHHAHILSVMGENGLQGPVCGFAFDGTGFGMDKEIWGGEVLLCNTQAFERFANVAYFPLPGGAAAIKNPARIAYGLLWMCDLLEHPAAAQLVEGLGAQAALLDQMIDQGINTPMTSSMGRLFDAVSALLGICTQPTYEGEAAILLEAAVWADEAARAQAAEKDYGFAIIKNVATETSTAEDTSVLLVDPAPVLEAILADLEAGVSTSCIAVRFHRAVVDMLITCAELVRAMYGISTVALAGGVFMNRYLLEQALDRLEASGFTVALNRDLPPNDASISYGQSVLALQSIDKR